MFLQSKFICSHHSRTFLTRNLSRRYICYGHNGSNSNKRTDSHLGKKGLVLGVFRAHNQPNMLSHAAQAFNVKNNNVICQFLKSLEQPMSLGQSVTLSHIDPEFSNVCIVGAGEEQVGYNELERMDECKENIRIATGVGTQKLRETGVTSISVDGLGDAGAAAEGAQLAAWRYEEDFTTVENQAKPIALHLYGEDDRNEWERGIIKASSQNIARGLSEGASNLRTPSGFAEAICQILCPCGVKLNIRDKPWIETNNMLGFLAAARGSAHRPVLVEASYCGGLTGEAPILLIGNGKTYDNDRRTVETSRGDMAGAAIVVAVLKAATTLNLPLNIKAILPLYENISSAMSIKAGEILLSKSGRPIMVEETSKEGALVLADAFTYGQAEYNPSMVLDVATLTRGARDFLGSRATAVFANSDDLWKELRTAGSAAGDRLWRMPLWQHFSHKVTEYPGSDIRSIGLGTGRSPCLAAAFLQEFINDVEWAHLDIIDRGVSSYGEEIPYYPWDQMTGRPMRTILQLLHQKAYSQTDQLGAEHQEKPTEAVTQDHQYLN